MSERITILGDGAMATVCSILLTTGGHEVTLWGAFEDSVEALLQDREQRKLLPGVKIPPQVRLTANDADCFDGATLILSAVPTQYTRGVWERLRPHAPVGIPIVSVAKGIETATLLRPTQIIRDVLSSQEAALRTDSSTLCALYPNFAERVQAAFSTQWLRVYTNADVVGVELAGATKNVIAIAAGILDGLGAGNNAKAALVTRGLVEITRLGVAMGAREATFQGLAGVGDLITTCVSPEGRNRTVGEQLGKGRKLDEILEKLPSVAEGVPTTQAVMQLARKFNVEMPITQAVHAVLFDGRDVIGALSDLMSRDPKPERVE